MRPEYVITKYAETFLRYHELFSVPKEEIQLLLSFSLGTLVERYRNENLEVADDENQMLKKLESIWKKFLIAYYRETRPQRLP